MKCKRKCRRSIHRNLNCKKRLNKRYSNYSKCSRRMWRIRYKFCSQKLAMLMYLYRTHINREEHRREGIKDETLSGFMVKTQSHSVTLIFVVLFSLYPCASQDIIIDNFPLLPS